VRNLLTITTPQTNQFSQIRSSLQITTGLGAQAGVSGGRAADRAVKTAGKLAGQPKVC